MEERKPGAYKVDEKGNIVPDENDETMAARHGLKKKKTKEEEVKEDAVRK